MKTNRLLCLSFCLLLSALTLIAAPRPKVGLVLGGGGAKGAAEIGALKFIEKYHIPIDYIAGTSIGAIVGSLYAAGYTASELDSLFCQHDLFPLLTDQREEYSDQFIAWDENNDMLIRGIPALNFRRDDWLGLLRGDSIKNQVERLLKAKGCSTFEALRRQRGCEFRCVASYFWTCRDTVLHTGDISSAVRASMALPLIFKNENSMSDGGMINNLPIDVVKAMGADIVIVVDLQQEKITGSAEGSNNAVSTILDWLTPDNSILNWIVQRPDRRNYLRNLSLYPPTEMIYIHPDLQGGHVASFGREDIARMMTIGEQTARHHKSELLRFKWRTTSFDIPWLDAIRRFFND